ncbi:MAG: type II toxin-antitoxin system Phd/YefM family antitoxin [Thermomicrobiales bacterium]
MQQIGVREFKAHTSEILRRVRDERETIEITSRGQAIARLTPIEQRPPLTKEEISRRFAALEKFAQEISKYWPDGVSAVDAVKENRRDL